MASITSITKMARTVTADAAAEKPVTTVRDLLKRSDEVLARDQIGNRRTLGEGDETAGEIIGRSLRDEVERS